jgi:hypothetical protein
MLKNESSKTLIGCRLQEKLEGFSAYQLLLSGFLLGLLLNPEDEGSIFL